MTGDVTVDMIGDVTGDVTGPGDPTAVPTDSDTVPTDSDKWQNDYQQHVRRPTLKIATGKLTPTWPVVMWPTNNQNYTNSGGQ